MILTERGTYYTGVTTDVQRRWSQHAGGCCGAKYLRANKPKALVYLELKHTHSSSLRREAEIKKLSKKKKEQCINSDLNELRLYVESNQLDFRYKMPFILSDIASVENSDDGVN